jgi:(heptosyl)LPS beta-1,4-glucosyltransferase
MPKLSAVIATFNEEKNIARCLSSVKAVADEIVVLDSFSTDRTAKICEEHGVKFIQRGWEGYSASKNYANSLASYDWILSLDADEELSPELIRSILEVKNGTELSNCSFNRLNNYCGKWIKHSGWYPDVKLRIFDRRHTSWQGTIHEKPVSSIDAPVNHLKGDCLHYSYYTIEEHYRQAEKFASLSAANMFAKGKRSGPAGPYIRAAAKFLRNYIMKAGFLDGSAGYTVCRITAYETYLKYSRLRQLASGS